MALQSILLFAQEKLLDAYALSCSTVRSIPKLREEPEQHLQELGAFGYPKLHPEGSLRGLNIISSVALVSNSFLLLLIITVFYYCTFFWYQGRSMAFCMKHYTLLGLQLLPSCTLLPSGSLASIKFKLWIVQSGRCNIIFCGSHDGCFSKNKPGRVKEP